MKFTITSLSGTRTLTATSTPCNGDASYVSYRVTDESGKPVAGGVCKSNEISKHVKTYARRMYVNVTEIKVEK